MENDGEQRQTQQTNSEAGERKTASEEKKKIRANMRKVTHD